MADGPRLRRSARWLLGVGLLVSCSSSAGDRGGGPTTSAGPLGMCSPRATVDMAFNIGGANRDETGDIAAVAADGRVLRLTSDGASYDPDFTPDGARIVFSSGSTFAKVSDSSGPEGLALYVMNANGSDRTRLTQSESDMHPDVSPDGRRVVFARGMGPDLQLGTRETRLRVIDIDGAHDRALLADTEPKSEVNDWYPTWSPSGDQIAFVRDVTPRQPQRPDGTYAEAVDSIWVVNADGSKPRSVLSGLRNAETLSWSPDGTRLTYDASSTDGIPEVDVLDLEHRKATHVARAASDPTWSADGRSLLYYQDAQVLGSHPAGFPIVEHNLSTRHDRVVPTGKAAVGYVYGYYDIDAAPCRRP